MDKIKIIEAGNELGLGGTENVIQLYSKFFNKEYFDVTVVGIRKGGEREKLIQDLGVKVIVLNGDLDKLAQLLQETDVFHWHGDGSLNPQLFEVIKANKPKLVLQTNVFGLYDHSAFYDIIDYDLFVSKMILIRRMYYDQNLPDNFASKRKALPNPIDVEHINDIFPSDNQIKRFKEENNLQDYFITGRIGRAADAKFDLITLDAFALFAKKVDHARFLLVGATYSMLSYAKALNITDKLIIFENTTDLEQLLIYYRSIDVFLAISQIGESFGIVIAEAMAAGVPVITVSTPDRDNAQIEVVDNRETGLVVGHNTQKIASALSFLYENDAIRAKLSAAAKQKVNKAYKANDVVKSLENLIFAHLGLSTRNPGASLIADYSQEITDDYANRFYDIWEPEIEFKQ